MGIIPYLFIPGQEDEDDYLPMTRKKCYVTSCDYMECERQAYLNTNSGYNFARSISLTIVLVPNCLIKRTLILYWNMSDITKIFVSSEQIVRAL